MGKNEEDKEKIEQIKRLLKAGKEEYFKAAESESQRIPKVNQGIFADIFANGYAQGFMQGEHSARKQIAKSMFLNPEYNSIGQIMDDTGVSFEYIESLAKEEEIKEEGKI